MGGNIMAPTDAQRRARDKWLSEKVETINLRVPKGSKEIIKTHAEKRGESTNAFVYRTVMEAIERDEKTDGGPWEAAPTHTPVGTPDFRGGGGNGAVRSAFWMKAAIIK